MQTETRSTLTRGAMRFLFLTLVVAFARIGVAEDGGGPGGPGGGPGKGHHHPKPTAEQIQKMTACLTKAGLPTAPTPGQGDHEAMHTYMESLSSSQKEQFHTCAEATFGPRPKGGQRPPPPPSGD